ncbi:uncharacterized protein LOC105199853 [Solenopsis invicta]|uniref:uncharacterized protein LOC105199853 n=1 Tax=Solenopsis invicta TaxID=13686 RepID=UPI000595AB9A|nr:uncharacterized protein LOC105199853 [Solenopsis invicta]
MLEPLIVLTVVNCIFMFSSTITTCALWWQYQGHRCCPRKNTAQQNFDSKKSKNYTLQNTVKKPGKSNFDGHANVVSKSDTVNSSRDHRSERYQKKRSKKSLEYQNRSGEKIFQDELEAKKFDKKSKMSEASQTVNDTKSTVVMELSTVQKIVQIVDDNSHINSARAPFKEIVSQKDTADKKRDYNVEQNGANVAANF